MYFEGLTSKRTHEAAFSRVQTLSKIANFLESGTTGNQDTYHHGGLTGSRRAWDEGDAHHSIRIQNCCMGNLHRYPGGYMRCF